MRPNRSIRLTDKRIPKLSKINALFVMLMKLKIKRLNKTIKERKKKTCHMESFSSILCEEDLKNTNRKLNKLLKMLKRNKKSNMGECQTVYNNEIDHNISFDILNGLLEGPICVLCLELFSAWQLGSVSCNCCKQYNYCGILYLKI